MVFSSTVFLHAFLPAFLALYFAVPARWVRARNAVLLGASLVFYAWGEPVLIWWMLASLLVNWLAGAFIARNPHRPARRRLGLLTALTVSFGLLAYFKYFGFLAANWDAVTTGLGLDALHIGPVAPIVMPLGISFYTFQGTSYVIDVYRGTVQPARHLLDFAAYKTMFPQLVAGPIVRYQTVAHEITDRRVTPALFAEGVQRFIVGLCKKVLVANVVAGPADAIFGLGALEMSPALSWVGIVAYTLQIYFDFSAYSDMAIGMGRMLGFHFLENFAHPYAALDVRDFWRRWHISLSTWLRDYLYVPLGGNRVGPVRTYANLWIVFLLCGLWHGASWTFVVWGAYHGGFLVLERLGLERAIERQPRILRHVYLMLVVMVGWVFFRADTLTHAVSFLGSMTGLDHAGGRARMIAEFVDPVTALALAAGAIGATGLPATIFRRLGERVATSGGGAALWWESARLGLAGTGAVAVWMMLANGSYNPFIYFRF